MPQLRMYRIDLHGSAVLKIKAAERMYINRQRITKILPTSHRPAIGVALSSVVVEGRHAIGIAGSSQERRIDSSFSAQR